MQEASLCATSENGTILAVTTALWRSSCAVHEVARGIADP
jgi:hypothetical protein